MADGRWQVGAAQLNAPRRCFLPTAICHLPSTFTSVFTPDERRALLFLAAVAACGGLVRVVRAARHGPEPPGASLVVPEIPAGNVARQAELSRRAAELARPLGPGETVDLDRAEAAEIERLPRVGKELAQRIVSERTANGPFGSLEGLGRVSGLGPATLRMFEGKVRFSGVAREAASGRREAESPPTVVGPASSARLPVCPNPPVPLNTATADQLACLPGIGPSLAARIVTFRTAHGPFREVKALQQVPGIGPARLARLLPLLSAP